MIFTTEFVPLDSISNGALFQLARNDLLYNVTKIEFLTSFKHAITRLAYFSHVS